MAFKLRSPLHNKPELPVANDGSDKFKNYQSNLKKTYMSSKDSGVGAYPDPQTGERTFYDKKHQSYDRKKGVTNKTGSFKGGQYIMNKPKPAAKPKSPYPANQGGSPLNNTFGAAASGLGSKIKKEYIKSNPSWQRSFGYDSEGNKISKSSFPSKITSTTGGASNLDFSKGDIIGQYGKGKSKPSTTKPSNDGVMVKDAEKNNAERIKKTKPATNTSTNTSTSKTTNNTKPIKSSDSDKGTGYFNDKLSFGVDTKLNVAPMPKFERTVTNARSADYDLVKAKGRGKISKLKSRLDRRQGKVENRVEKSLNRIDARQQRQGTKYAGKMKAAQIKSDKGKTDPGYFDSQKKLDAYEKSMDSPKATPKTSGAGNIPGAGKIGDSKSMPSLRTPKSNQAVAKSSNTSNKGIRPNNTVQKSLVIDDSKIKKGTKEAKGGQKVKESTYKGLTGFKNEIGSSGGLERGMPKSSTSITKPASGPRATTVKVESGPNARQKAIMNVYNNIRK